MNKYILKFSLIFTLILSAFQLQAATAEIEWQEPENYVDIRSGNEPRGSFRERVFYNLDKHIKKLAEQLPEDYVYKMVVTDLDLAGDTLIGGINQVRIIKDVYIPRIKFSYQLLDGAGVVLLSAEEVNLKDMGFMQSLNLRYKNDNFGYEKQMLEEWFDTTFEQYMNEH